jgi:hypothetical protein
MKRVSEQDIPTPAKHEDVERMIDYVVWLVLDKDINWREGKRLYPLTPKAVTAEVLERVNDVLQMLQMHAERDPDHEQALLVKKIKTDDRLSTRCAQRIVKAVKERSFVEAGVWSAIADEVDSMERLTDSLIVALLEAAQKERQLYKALTLPIWRETAEVLTREAKRQWPNPLWDDEVNVTEEGDMVQERVQNLCVLVEEISHQRDERDEEIQIKKRER